jgi:hypothetical protein
VIGYSFSFPSGNIAGASLCTYRYRPKVSQRIDITFFFLISSYHLLQLVLDTMLHHQHSMAMPANQHRDARFVIFCSL